MESQLPLAPQPALLDQPPATPEDPNWLSYEANKAVQAFLYEGHSRNTARTYATALRYWGAWHTLRYGVPIEGPISPKAVIQFIVDHLEHQPDQPPPDRTPYTPSSQTTQHLLPLAIDELLVRRHYKEKLGPWSMATVKIRLAALSKAHENYIARNPHLNLTAATNPARDPQVRQLVSAATRAYARRGKLSRRPNAATKNVMEALLATCGDDLIGKRDRALLLFGWASGGRRRSEITAATFENVKRDGDGFVYELGRSKTNQSGSRDPARMKPIQGAAAEALQAWINCLLEYRITQGAIFRRVLNGRIVEPLKDSAVRNIVQARAKLANQPLGRLSAHSLRSGFVTEAGKQGVALGEVMAMTGHKSVQTVTGYYQSGSLAVSKAAKLIDSN